MSLSVQVNQYWQLGRVVLFPARFVCWLFAIIFSLIALGSIFSPQGKEMFLAVSAGISFFLLAIIGMQVPGQMLALASSKQFRHLADLRGKLFAISFVFWFSTALIGSCFFYNLSTHKFTFWEILSLAVAATSFIATTLVIIIARYPSAMAVYPLVFSIALPEFFKTFALTEEVQSLYLWSGSAILWIIFYVWWQGWKPKKYLANAMTLSSTEVKKIFKERESAGNKSSSQPKTLSGSLLLGESDAFPNRAKREILLPILFLGLGLAFILWRNITPDKIPVQLVAGIIFILIIARGGFLLELLHGNVYRLWMNINHSRMEIFSHLETFYFSALITFSVPCLLFIAGANYFLFNNLISPFLFGYLILITLFCVAYSYYLGMVIYARLSASPMIVSFILLATYVCLITGMVFFNIFWGSNISQSHADYLWCAGLLAGLTILFRQWAKSSWKRVNFYRVKS